MFRAPAFLIVAATALAAAQGDPAKGKQLFVTCAGCHNVDSDQRKMGPSLRSLFGRVTLRNGKRASDENVREIVLDGYNGMPSFRYSYRPSEIDDLLAYLHTLTAAPAATPELSAGENVFRAFCARCHTNGSQSSPAQVLRGTLTAEQMKLVDEGHGGAPAMKDWLDTAARENLLGYIKGR